MSFGVFGDDNTSGDGTEALSNFMKHYEQSKEVEHRPFITSQQLEITYEDHVILFVGGTVDQLNVGVGQLSSEAEVKAEFPDYMMRYSNGWRHGSFFSRVLGGTQRGWLDLGTMHKVLPEQYGMMHDLIEEGDIPARIEGWMRDILKTHAILASEENEKFPTIPQCPKCNRRDMVLKVYHAHNAYYHVAQDKDDKTQFIASDDTMNDESTYLSWLCCDTCGFSREIPISNIKKV